jgi:nucleoside-diphosphate-sugar epimerase
MRVFAENIIEFVRINKIKGFIFASSSSVYGSTKKISAKENQKTNPKSFYALTKSIDEQIALYYSKMYGSFSGRCHELL